MAKKVKNEQYWREGFSVTEEEELALQTYIEEQGEPLTLNEIARIVVRQQLEEESAANTGIYMPHETYAEGQKLSFPALGNRQGEVAGIRPGNNPRYGTYDVISVRFGAKEPPREFIAGSSTFQLQSRDNRSTPRLSEEEIFAQFGTAVEEVVQAALEDSGEYVTYGSLWMPRAMLVPVHEGHLNIAEAMVDMVGSPLSSAELLPEIDLESTLPERAQRFSLNYGLAQDPRFVNVGSESEPRWDINHG